MTDTIQNQPKTRRDTIEMDNVRSQKANLKKNTDANQLLSLRKRLDVLLRTGQLLLESSADTNRIRRNMVRAALFLGFNEDNLHIFIDHNILMVNYSDEAHSFTKFQKRVKDGINFTTIEAISHLTYKAVRKHFSVEDYEAELEKIAARPRNYNQLVTSAGAALACGGFCIQFGCDWTAFLYASLAAFIGFNCRVYFNKLGVNKYFSIAIAAFVSTLIAWITTYLPGMDHDTAPPAARMRPLHCTGRAAHQLRGRHARHQFPSRHGTSHKHSHDDGRHGIRYRAGIESMQLGLPLRTRHHVHTDGSGTPVLDVRHGGSHIGHGILDDFQYPETPASGSRDRRHHCCLHP